MLKHIDKIHTFLVVYDTKSFSKASKELSISQPAVTQQIKQLESFLNTSLIERKKSGIILTKEGKRFLEIANELKEYTDKIQQKIDMFTDKQFPFFIGASPTVGNYILPKYIQDFNHLVGKDLGLIVKDNYQLLKDLRENIVDLAFTTYRPIDAQLDYKTWFKDELVFFSNRQLPTSISFEDLITFKMICREEESSTRRALNSLLEEGGYSCNAFNIISHVHNSTALKQMILNSREQLVSVISKHAIKDELKQKRLFSTKVVGVDLERDIFLVFNKEKTDSSIQSIVGFLTS